MINRWLRAHPSLVWLVALTLAAVGAVSIYELPSSIYPEMTFPRIVVVAKTAQLSSDLVEAQVTRPLEEALVVVPGVRHIRARTIRGATELSLLLVDGTDPLTAQFACRAAIDHVTLPTGTTTLVERVLPTSVPVITFNVTARKGATTDPRRLREVAEGVIRPAVARVRGVGGVEVGGGRVRQIQVIVRPAELAALHVTPSQLAKAIEAQDQVISAGRVFDEHQTLPVVLDVQAADLERLRALPIAKGPTGPVVLASVADVVDGAEDPDLVVSGPRGEAVALSVSRLPGASTTAVVDGVIESLEALRRHNGLPADVDVEPVYDQASLVHESLGSVRDAILIGIALSLIVIALSLRDWRAGLIAALPVPITLLGTFAVMRWFGMTLNLMSLGGLAISIGLVVDDAIVVAEGIVRRLEEGHTSEEAVELGTQDMFGAVVGTTITTVVVFAPLALLSGITGSFLGALAATLAIAVLLSMVVALTLIPSLAHRLRARRRDEAARLTTRSARMIHWLLRHRLVAVAVVVLLLVSGGVASRLAATGFLPHMDEGAFIIDFTLPPGTSLEETARITARVDDVLRETKEVVSFTRRVGTELGPATATLQNTGDIMVRLVAPGNRGEIEDIMDHVRGELHARVPEARFELMQILQDVLADLAGNPSPIEVRILGDDRAALERYAEKAGERLAKLDMLEDFFDGREGAAPVLRGQLDLPQISRLGLDAATVGEDLSVALAGREVAEVLRPERTIGVRVRYPDPIRENAEALRRSPIAYGPGSLSLGDVVAFDRPLAPAVLLRDGLRATVVMTAAVKEGDLGGAEAAVRHALAGIPTTPGVQTEIGGQAETARTARFDLYKVGLSSTLLVLIVLIIQLHSLGWALVVLVGAPLSTAGGLLVLTLTGMPLDVSSMTGLILLVGLVVKNGILMLEQARRAYVAGASVEDALEAAARRRLRPILMTTGATLAGLAPLALGVGAGAELQRPLAITVIGGLAFATLVTLVVTPGLTALVTRRRTDPVATSAGEPS